MQTMNSRQERGQVITTVKRAIKRINGSTYLVKSQSGNSKYEVSATKLGWICSCPDQRFRRVKCKHIYALEISFAICNLKKSYLL
jgi:putative transposase